MLTIVLKSFHFHGRAYLLDDAERDERLTGEHLQVPKRDMCVAAVDSGPWQLTTIARCCHRDMFVRCLGLSLQEYTECRHVSRLHRSLRRLPS